jgi:hypothetical protein
MAALKKSRREQVQGDLHRRARGRRLHRGRRERQSHRPEARGQSGHDRHLRLFLPRRECRQAEGHAINGVAPTYQTISSFKYPGARPLYIYVKNAHAGAIPAVRAFVAEFTKESAFGPNGYLLKSGLIAAPNNIRARSQQAARTLAPLNLGEPQIASARSRIILRAPPNPGARPGLPRTGAGERD